MFFLQIVCWGKSKDTKDSRVLCPPSPNDYLRSINAQLIIILAIIYKYDTTLPKNRRLIFSGSCVIGILSACSMQDSTTQNSFSSSDILEY